MSNWGTLSLSELASFGSGGTSFKRVSNSWDECKRGEVVEFMKVKLVPKSATLNEIDVLKALAEQYRTQRRELMQKLLTGKWKVKTNG